MKKIIIENWRKFFVFSLLLPVITNLVIYFYYLDTLFLITSITLMYYLLLALALFLAKKYNVKKRKPRSPFYFIRQFHTTGNKLYWDEYQKPLRHLVGIEIGVHNGENAKKVVDFLNIKEMYLVDSWKEYIDYETGITWDTKGHEEESQEVHDLRYKHVKKLFQNYNNVKIIKNNSEEAAKEFSNNYFDFIYLDGDHSYDAVKMDLAHWHPKLKKYGVMCGDDYGHISGLGVIEAVQEFAFQNKLLIQTGDDNQFWYVKTTD